MLGRPSLAVLPMGPILVETHGAGRARGPQGDPETSVRLRKSAAGMPPIISANANEASAEHPMQPHPNDDQLCSQCGRCYETSKGCPSVGIAAGTPWEDVPADWHCPDCGAPKCYFDSCEVLYMRAYSVLAGF